MLTIGTSAYIYGNSVVKPHLSCYRKKALTLTRPTVQSFGALA